jgi:SNF2 family DNA or RNA helicase
MTQLYPFQEKGVRLLERFEGRALLADEMGLGKTIQALMYLKQHPKARPAIVVCPASVKWVWQDQARQHCGLRTTVCSGMKAPKKGMLPQDSIFIINYDILLPWSIYLRDLHPKIVILDECHAIKSRGIWRTKAVRKLCSPIRRVSVDGIAMANTHDVPPNEREFREDDRVEFIDRDGQTVNGFITTIADRIATIKTQIPHLIALSGTPLTNRPAELWSVLNLIWPKEFPAFTPFAWEYCEPEMIYGHWQFKGAANLDKLHRKLKHLGMIRRLKQDVLKDLPAKQRFVIPMDIDNRDEYEEAKNDVVRWLRKTSISKALRASKAKKMVQMAYLRRIAAKGKIPEIIEWIDNFLEESDTKLVVAALHHEVIDALHDHYKHISVTFTGKTSPNGRRTILQAFQKNPSIRIIIGQIKAIGTGVDGLQHTSNTTAVIELPWDPGTLSQLDDRIHRIGQKKAVSIYYLVAKDTLEENLCQIIQKKQDVLTQTLDGGNLQNQMKLDIYDLLERELLK